MEDLIKALQIFRKYGNPAHPTHCEHDMLRVNIDPSIVSQEDIDELYQLGFGVDIEFDVFKSYKYGSC